MANDTFIWAFTLAIVGVSLPVVLAGATHQEQLAKHEKELTSKALEGGSEEAVSEMKKDYSKVLALLYMLLVYGLGFIFANLPSFYMNHYRGMNEREIIQSRSLSPGYKLICGL